MTNHVLLDNKTHKDIRINTSKTVKLGSNISHTLTFPNEYLNIQRDYPILFSKNKETGTFQSVVMFGLRANENLFLKRGKWHASYIPAAVDKEPFLIGFDEQEVDGQKVSNPMVCIDMDSPRVNYSDGEAVFTKEGKNTNYLNNVSNNLMIINDGVELSNQMFTAFVKYDLLEAVTLNIELKNGEKISIDGNLTINQKKLSTLDGKALEDLNKKGFLQMAYLVLASLNNLEKLIELLNDRVTNK